MLMSLQTKVLSFFTSSENKPTNNYDSFLSSNPFNKKSIRIWVFLGLIALAQLFIGYFLGSRQGLFIGFLLSVSFTFLIFYFGSPDLLRLFEAREIRGQDPSGILKLAQEFSLKIDFPTPQVFLISSKAPVCFSVLHISHPSVLAVSEGLLKSFSQAEVAALVAHRIASLKAMDQFRVAVGNAIAHSIIGLGRVLDQAIPLNWFTRKNIAGPFQWLLSPIAFIILKLTFFNQDTYSADDLAGTMIGEKNTLAKALWKLDSYALTQPVKITLCTAHLFPVNPGKIGRKNWLQTSHPSIENRLRRLVGTYPL